MNTFRWPTLALLLIAAVASGALIMRMDKPPQAARSGPEFGIGYYMKGAELLRMDDSGRVLYRLQTDEATQTEIDGIITLDLVKVSYDPQSDVPWDLRADTGYILPNRNIIQLEGDVVASTREDNQESVRIKTEFLQLDTETYIADTDREVTVDYSANKVIAKGLRAYLKEERLQLVADVNGVFIP